MRVLLSIHSFVPCHAFSHRIGGGFRNGEAHPAFPAACTVSAVFITSRRETLPRFVFIFFPPRFAYYLRMLHPWHDVTPGQEIPREFLAIIEIPFGSSVKYELDKQSGMIKLDRVLYSA